MERLGVRSRAVAVSTAWTNQPCWQVALITDGRFSGGSHGFIIGHVTPEAQVRSPPAPSMHKHPRSRNEAREAVWFVRRRSFMAPQLLFSCCFARGSSAHALLRPARPAYACAAAHAVRPRTQRPRGCERAVAQVGGPIALVRDGDRVVIDADVRSIDVPDVSAAEFAQRRLVHTHPFTHAPIATSRQALFP